MKIKSETKLQIQICDYIKLQYPNVLFKSELSGQNTSHTQMKINKRIRSSRGFPDLEILETNEKYCGLYIELKTANPFKLSGELKKNYHTSEQSKMLLELNKRGYKALFCWSFTDAKKIIDDYLAIPKKETPLFSLIKVTKGHKKRK